jgi:hypothetical protein
MLEHVVRNKLHVRILALTNTSEANALRYMDLQANKHRIGFIQRKLHHNLDFIHSVCVRISLARK